MKYMKIILFLLLAVSAGQASAKKTKTEKVADTTVYAVGVATSFNDSVAYCTELQTLDDATLDRKLYLHRRSGYSFQLRDYLVTQGKPNYTCLVLFNTKKAKLEKQLAKVMARFAKANSRVVEIKEQEFKFTKPEEL